jgi:hypothetical protein
MKNLQRRLRTALRRMCGLNTIEREHSSMRTTLKVLVIIALFVIGYVAYWQYQYKRAESAANDFCATVELESDIARTIELLGAKETMHHGFQENQSRYVVIFKGPIFNAYTCELALTDRKVTSKRVVEPVD